MEAKFAPKRDGNTLGIRPSLCKVTAIITNLSRSPLNLIFTHMINLCWPTELWNFWNSLCASPYLILKNPPWQTSVYCHCISQSLSVQEWTICHAKIFLHCLNVTICMSHKCVLLERNSICILYFSMKQFDVCLALQERWSEGLAVSLHSYWCIAHFPSEFCSK